MGVDSADNGLAALHDEIGNNRVLSVELRKLATAERHTRVHMHDSVRECVKGSSAGLCGIAQAHRNGKIGSAVLEHEGIDLRFSSQGHHLHASRDSAAIQNVS